MQSTLDLLRRIFGEDYNPPPGRNVRHARRTKHGRGHTKPRIEYTEKQRKASKMRRKMAKQSRRINRGR